MTRATRSPATGPTWCSSWPTLPAQEAEKSGQPAFLVGHSLGGFLSLMCAARNPVLGGQPVRGVLLLDSPVLGGWRAKALSVAKRARLVGSISPGAISRKRRQQWLGRDEVLAHFRSKKAFARWDEQVLRDYIDHGTHDEGGSAQGQRLLSFDRDVETAIYNTLPDNLESLLKAPSAQMPVGLHWRAAVGRNEAGRHGHDRKSHPWPHHDARRQPPVPDGATAGHGRRHRGGAAQHGEPGRALDRGLIRPR